MLLYQSLSISALYTDESTDSTTIAMAMTGFVTIAVVISLVQATAQNIDNQNEVETAQCLQSSPKPLNSFMIAVNYHFTRQCNYLLSHCKTSHIDF